MVLSREVSLQVTSTPLAPKKVRLRKSSKLICIGPDDCIGWAPSTFVSSRSERAKQQAARPEDFMDEEDLAELRESKQLVDENEEMDFAGTEAELRKGQGPEADPENECVSCSALLHS